jgi:methylated-DNA-[protein]-cysteine S-methyltransferase
VTRTATAVITTPLGPFAVTATDGAVVAARWVDGPAASLPVSGIVPESETINATGRDEGGVLGAAVRELREYFDGERRVFEVPVDLAGAGSFQRQVLDAAANIPYGTTRTYGDLAKDLGGLEVVRAVGGALKHNPVAVIVPCHRVVAADGALTGYGGAPGAGGRLDLKKALLEIERGALQQRLW